MRRESEVIPCSVEQALWLSMEDVLEKGQSDLGRPAGGRVTLLKKDVVARRQETRSRPRKPGSASYRAGTSGAQLLSV